MENLFSNGDVYTIMLALDQYIKENENQTGPLTLGLLKTLTDMWRSGLDFQVLSIDGFVEPDEAIVAYAAAHEIKMNLRSTIVQRILRLRMQHDME